MQSLCAGTRSLWSGARRAASGLSPAALWIRARPSPNALREFKEEAGVDLRAVPGLILGIYRPLAFDAIDRDPRSRIISGAVLITLSEEVDRPELIAGDDADAEQWQRWDAIPALYADHNAIVEALLAPCHVQEIGAAGQDKGF